MMEAALVSRGAEQGALRARNAELASQLRAAALEGDDARIRRLLSELLRFQGLSKGQRVSLQMKALLNMVQALRCVALTDDLTGLCNWRGSMQIDRKSTRLNSSYRCISYAVFCLKKKKSASAARLVWSGTAASYRLCRSPGHFLARAPPLGRSVLCRLPFRLTRAILVGRLPTPSA